HRAHVEENLARAEASQHSFRTFRDRRDRGSVGYHGKGKIRGGGHGTRRVRPFHTLVNQPLRLRAGAIVPGHAVTLAQQPVHHLATHDAETDKSDFRHARLASEIMKCAGKIAAQSWPKKLCPQKACPKKPESPRAPVRDAPAWRRGPFPDRAVP